MPDQVNSLTETNQREGFYAGCYGLLSRSKKNLNKRKLEWRSIEEDIIMEGENQEVKS